MTKGRIDGHQLGILSSKGSKGSPTLLRPELGNIITITGLLARNADTGNMGFKNKSWIDAYASYIVSESIRYSKYKNDWQRVARSISGYAAGSPAEMIAEAVTDVYCNGSKANEASRRIFRYLKEAAGGQEVAYQEEAKRGQEGLL